MSIRTEQEIFHDLGVLCSKPGYAHAIAYFCFRDHVVGYDSTIKGEDYANQFSYERLIRNEISTLVGLMARTSFDLTMPDPATIQDYIERTEALLKELHTALEEPARIELENALSDPKRIKKSSLFASAEVLREPIFCGAESAYSFQYRDLSVEKYTRDAEWIKEHKGFTPDEARNVVVAVCAFLNSRLLKTLNDMRELSIEEWTFLSGFRFTITDIVAESGLSEYKVRAVVDAFTCPKEGNPTFTALNEFNAANAFPILQSDDDSRILFLYVSLTEALYETPFYWMIEDRGYADIATINRGLFAEEFSAVRLERVFGAQRVFRNVDIWETKARRKKLGEIDTLVVFGDRLIVVQAKSKRLTLVARKGHDLQLKSDFKAAVQDACNQAVSCSKNLLNGLSFLTDISGKEIKIEQNIKKIHPVCIVSDHYPALSLQSREFLAFDSEDRIQRPLICDIFFLDVMTEFLDAPLHFLNYLELRARVEEKLNISHEIVALGFHLRQNLWLAEYDHVTLEDDISVDIDIAMAARRDGLDGEKNPPGILTELKGTAVGRILDEIERQSEPNAIATALHLLKLSGKSAKDLGRVIDKITADAAEDGIPHDFTMAFDQEGGGITIHCNAWADGLASRMLRRHCEMRKYSSKADSWFGLNLRPGDGAIRFGLMLDYPWVQDVAMDAAVAKMPAPKSVKAIGRILKGKERQTKIGRNHPCPCGSGLKYKKCHLPKGGFR